MFCKFCKDLSIEKLVKLAEAELVPHEFPQEAYYQHHASYSDLISSSSNGCELCKLIYEGFQQTVMDGSTVYWEGSTMDAAIQDIGSRGYATDLKICINAAHLYFSERIEAVKLFDIFMVQAGIVEPQLPDEDFDYENGIPPLQLILNVPRGSSSTQIPVRYTESTERPFFYGKYRIGRYETDFSLGSITNNALARGWLNECASSHEECKRAKISKLPSRVLDVGTVETPISRIYISNEVDGDYVALSHCWGGAISPLLTVENLADFQISIPFFHLPANFRDAITITRELRIRYLWIDSLCIVQNSKEDWEIESKKMCSIYRDAKVMVSAAASSRSTDGILKHTWPIETRDCAVTLRLFASIDSNEVAYISKKHTAPQNLRDLLTKSPLSSRGWTLQEGLLASRILFYGDNQIYWWCQKGFRSADGVPTGNLMPEYDLYPEFAKIAHSHVSSPKEENSDAILEEYYKLVSAYTERNLSFEADKLPAFSGIAEILHPILSGEYLAGIWSNDIQGLLWHRTNQHCEHVSQYRAPSWSWAVTNQPVSFQCEKKEGYQDFYEAQFISHKIELATQSPYGQIRSGRIMLKGFTKTLVRSTQTIVDSFDSQEKKYDFGTIWYDDDSDYGRLFHIQGAPDDYLLSVSEISRWQNGKEVIASEFKIDQGLFSKQNHIAFFVKSWPVIQDEADTLYRRGSGLILVEAEGSDSTYIRVGVFAITMRYKPDFEKWMETWEIGTITII